MHFVTLTVSPPCTGHNLMHNSTRCMSRGQKGLQVRFCENVHFEPFLWAIAHAPYRFSELGPIFECHPRCSKIFVLIHFCALDQFLALGPIFVRHYVCEETSVSSHFHGYSTCSRPIFRTRANFRVPSQICENVRLCCFRGL
jgi:hypothetical protein